MGRLSYTEAQIDEGIGRALTELAEKPATSTAGNLASLKADGNLEDSGILATDVALKSEVENITPKRTASNDPSNSSFSVLCDTAIAGEAKPKLYGKSAVINQLVGILPTDASVTANNVTITDNRDGSYTIQTTAEGASANTSISVCNNVTNSVKTQSGHIYFKRGANTAKGVQIQDSYAGWNLTSTDEAIFTRTAAGTGFSNIALYIPQGTIITTPVKVYPQTIDLTACGFTSAETASVSALKTAWLKKYGTPMPTYIDYNPGSIVSNNATYQMRGRNLFDAATAQDDTLINRLTGEAVSNAGYACSPYIKVAPSAAYYASGVLGNATYAAIVEYDANKQFIRAQEIAGSTPASGSITTAENTAFIRLNMMKTAKSTVMFSLGSTATAYEAYYNGGSVTADALNGIGTAVDEQDADGQIVRKIATVDLGTLTWTYNAGYMQTTGISSAVKIPATIYGATTAICGMYKAVAQNSLSLSNNMTFAVSGSGTLTIVNTAYSDAATFTTAMSGVYLAYELATPTTDSTSAASIQTQAGYNSLDPVAGDVQSADAECEYGVDIVAYVDKKIGELNV